MDTDGCINRGKAEFTTISRKLIFQVSSIIRFLGFEFKVAKWNYGRGTAYKMFMRTLESKKLVEVLQPRNSKRLTVSNTLIDHHEEDKIVRLRKSGMKVYDISKRVGRSHASISKVLLKNGLSKKRTSREEAVKILRMWSRGCNRDEICDISKKSRRSVNWTISKRSSLLT